MAGLRQLVKKYSPFRRWGNLSPEVGLVEHESTDNVSFAIVVLAYSARTGDLKGQDSSSYVKRHERGISLAAKLAGIIPIQNGAPDLESGYMPTSDARLLSLPSRKQVRKILGAFCALHVQSRCLLLPNDSHEVVPSCTVHRITADLDLRSRRSSRYWDTCRGRCSKWMAVKSVAFRSPKPLPRTSKAFAAGLPE
jgi:hypothetical protein